jgi:hypothetical protein
MTVRVTTGTGTLYDKDTPDLPLARITFNLLEIDATKYTRKKWWGDFNLGHELKHLGNYIIGFEDTRKGECVIIANTESGTNKNTTKTWYYHFNGRGGLGRR